MSRLRIVDAHHHLWDLQAVHYPWLMARGERRFFGDPTAIQRNYLVSELRADAAEFDLVASVHVQVGAAEGDHLRETRWLDRTAREHGLPQAIVGYIDLSQHDIARDLECHRESERFRGVRQIIGRAPHDPMQAATDALLDNPRWNANLARLAAAGVTFDLQLVVSQAERAAKVFAQHPNLQVALCHCGSPWDQSAQGLRAWRGAARRLASLPNVYCKLSGFGMFDPAWTSASIEPIVAYAIDAFGPKRVMFGSNFPVEKLVSSYTRLWRTFEQLCSGASETERDDLFWRTASTFYRLGETIK
jgi:predicted TIM-barrel fold metal-dependent hydrolase